jgi:hypothetical protein
VPAILFTRSPWGSSPIPVVVARGGSLASRAKAGAGRWGNVGWCLGPNTADNTALFVNSTSVGDFDGRRAALTVETMLVRTIR